MNYGNRGCRVRTSGARGRCRRRWRWRCSSMMLARPRSSKGNYLQVDIVMGADVRDEDEVMLEAELPLVVLLELIDEVLSPAAEVEVGLVVAGTTELVAGDSGTSFKTRSSTSKVGKMLVLTQLSISWRV